MNIELLERVAQKIEQTPDEFNMAHFEQWTDCGTSRCIGGWICNLGGVSTYSRGKTVVEKVAELIDVSHDTAQDLCFPIGDSKFGGWIATAEQAAARIRHFINTGELNFDVK